MVFNNSISYKYLKTRKNFVKCEEIIVVRNNFRFVSSIAGFLLLWVTFGAAQGTIRTKRLKSKREFYQGISQITEVFTVVCI